jgi:hypothetical protein
MSLFTAEKVVTIESNRVFSYRVTGLQATERICPLLDMINPTFLRIDTDCCTIQKLDFVWETACELKWRNIHGDASVINRLHNSQVQFYEYYTLNHN